MFTKFGIMSGQKRDLTDYMSCNKETLFPALSCAFIHGDFFYLFIYLLDGMMMLCSRTVLREMTGKRK